MNELDIYEILEDMMYDVIQENEPYLHITPKEKIRFLYGGDNWCGWYGDIKKMTEEEFLLIIEHIDGRIKPYTYQSEMEALLDSLFVQRWREVKTPMHGRKWISYLDLIREKYEVWISEQSDFVDEKTDEIDEHLEMKLDECFYEYFCNTDWDTVVEEVLKTMQNLTV